MVRTKTVCGFELRLLPPTPCQTQQNRNCTPGWYSPEPRAPSHRDIFPRDAKCQHLSSFAQLPDAETKFWERATTRWAPFSSTQPPLVGWIAWYMNYISVEMFLKINRWKNIFPRITKKKIYEKGTHDSPDIIT